MEFVNFLTEVRNSDGFNPFFVNWLDMLAELS